MSRRSRRHAVEPRDDGGSRPAELRTRADRDAEGCRSRRLRRRGDGVLTITTGATRAPGSTRCCVARPCCDPTSIQPWSRECGSASTRRDHASTGVPAIDELSEWGRRRGWARTGRNDCEDCLEPCWAARALLDPSFAPNLGCATERKGGRRASRDLEADSLGEWDPEVRPPAQAGRARRRAPVAAAASAQTRSATSARTVDVRRARGSGGGGGRCRPSSDGRGVMMVLAVSPQVLGELVDALREPARPGPRPSRILWTARIGRSAPASAPCEVMAKMPPPRAPAAEKT